MKTYKVTVDKYNTVRWYNEQSQLHREGAPAIEWADGDKFWYINGELHREDGPAVEFLDGGKEWWNKDSLHRLDGPAVECASGHKAWYINGKQLTEKEFLAQTKPPCEGKVVKIDGKKYKLTAI